LKLRVYSPQIHSKVFLLAAMRTKTKIILQCLFDTPTHDAELTFLNPCLLLRRSKNSRSRKKALN
jgi:hypothetical protein